MSESYGKSSSPASFRSSSSVKGSSPLPKDVPQTRISGFGVKAQTTTTMKNSSSSSELAKTPPMSTPTRVSPSLSSNSLHSSGIFSPSSAAEEGDCKTHAGFDTTTTTTTNAASTTTSV